MNQRTIVLSNSSPFRFALSFLPITGPSDVRIETTLTIEGDEQVQNLKYTRALRNMFEVPDVHRGVIKPLTIKHTNRASGIAFKIKIDSSFHECYTSEVKKALRGHWSWDGVRCLSCKIFAPEDILMAHTFKCNTTKVPASTREHMRKNAVLPFSSPASGGGAGPSRPAVASPRTLVAPCATCATLRRQLATSENAHQACKQLLVERGAKRTREQDESAAAEYKRVCDEASDVREDRNRLSRCNKKLKQGIDAALEACAGGASPETIAETLRKTITDAETVLEVINVE